MKKVHTEKNRSGFTLVEILVVIAVLSLIGGLVLTIFTRTLRGNNKSQIIAQIKENGQSVLETIGQTIRNADNVACVSNSQNSIVVVKNGLYTRFRFVLDLTGATNGSIQQDNPIPSESETTPAPFINRVCLPENTPLTNTLTDTNPQSGVSVLSGSFIRDKPPGLKDLITIKFTLTPGVATYKAVAGQIDPVNFQSTIELR